MKYFDKNYKEPSDSRRIKEAEAFIDHSIKSIPCRCPVPLLPEECHDNLPDPNYDLKDFGAEAFAHLNYVLHAYRNLKKKLKNTN